MLFRKHRRCDTTVIVRNIPETCYGLKLTQQLSFCPQKAMLAGRVLQARSDTYSILYLRLDNNLSNSFISFSISSVAEHRDTLILKNHLSIDDIIHETDNA